jgi:hypothetical protein
MKTHSILLSTLLLSACGDLLKEKTAAETADTSAALVSTAEKLQFQGSVQYAFDLTVDGEKFSDIEAYYTKQILGLAKKVADAGYKADSVEFVGRMGFSDFIQDMTVFVSSSGGLQGRGVVNAQGNFEVNIANPTLKTGGTFKIRATKRVQILLLNGGSVTKKLCYNFSAVEKNVADTVVSLENFRTDFTLYDCEQVSDGMAIPPAEQTAPMDTHTLMFQGEINAVWADGGNEFFVDAGATRRKYFLPRDGKVAPCALGGSEMIHAEAPPEGFSPFERSYRDFGSGNRSTVTVDGDTLFVRDNTSWSEITVVRGGVTLKSFRVNFGLCFFAVHGTTVIAIGRHPSSNNWSVGVLDIAANRFIPRATAPSAIIIDKVGVIAGNYVVTLIPDFSDRSEMHFFRI